MVEQKMQQIELLVKQKFEDAKKQNTKAAMTALQWSDSEAFSKIQRVLESEDGYSGENLPSKDFQKYIADLRSSAEGSNLPEYDRYTYYKDVLPKRIHKIHSNLRRAFKKEDKKEELDDREHLLKLELEQTRGYIEQEATKKDDLQGKIRELKRKNREKAKAIKL